MVGTTLYLLVFCGGREMFKCSSLSGLAQNRLAFACVYAHIHVCMYVHMCVRMYVCMYVYMYVCMYVCMYVSMYV